MTIQRRMILDELRASRSHPTADEVYERVKRKLPRISLGTVYRNLEALASQGAIQRLDLAGVQRRFDHAPAPHHHVRCVRCGALEDIILRGSAHPDQLVQDARGFEILDAKLEFLGICPECREPGPPVPRNSHFH
ncbi:MAG: transcriptional repressor [Syntrophobacteraceae bacterium]|nr:transcriptional repressor [Syntrophobacteraceae bacterium]